MVTAGTVVLPLVIVMVVPLGTSPVTIELNVTIDDDTAWTVVPLGILVPVADIPALMPVVDGKLNIDPVEAFVS